MSQPPDEQPPSTSYWFWRSSVWYWLALLLGVVVPLLLIGHRFYAANQVVVGKNGFVSIARGHHPALVERWIGRDRLVVLKSVKHATLGPTKGDVDAGIWWLGGQRQLKGLTVLSRHTSATFRLIAEHCPQLEGLHLRSLNLTVDDFRQIARLSNLSTLYLFDCHVPDGALSELSNQTSLHFLVYERGHALSDASLRELAGLTSLWTLNLDIGDVELEKLLQPFDDGTPALANLRFLTLHDARFTGATLDRLANLPKLTHLTLSETKVDDQALKQLETVTKLTQLYLARCPITDESCLSLAKLTNLESLHLGGTKITMQGVRQLTDLKRLRQLNLKQCYGVDNIVRSPGDPSPIDSLPKSFLSRCRVLR